MKATVLLINFQDKARLGKIQKALLPLGYRLKRVQKESYLQTIGYLAGVSDMAPVPDVYEGDEFEQEMMVLAGLSRSMLDQLLLALRKAGVGKINYKAMLTETNQHWNVMELYKEISREHEAMSK